MAFGSGDLFYGNRGDDVSQLQSYLVSQGFNPGRIDGIWGPRTQAAYNSWAQSRGVPLGGLTPQAWAIIVGTPPTPPEPPLPPEPPPPPPPPPVLPPPGGDPELPPIEPPPPEPPSTFDFYSAAANLYPYLPRDLLNVFTQAWADTGQQELAWASTQANPLFIQYYPGIRRADGSMRMSLAEYIGTRHAYEDRLLDAGINPGIFQSQLTGLIEGEVSANEFRARVDAIEERVVTQEAEVQQSFVDFGFALDRASIFAAMLDPAVGQNILDRQITMAEIGGEAALQGFMLSRDAALGLVQAGQDRQGSRQLFQTAGQVLPGLGRASLRQSEGAFDLEAFIESQVFANPTETGRIGRVLAGEASSFTPERTDVRRSDSGAVTGLRPR
jgi:peptidoglycan hydrolase-like protein with peptidoglycan-binding domain